jgi:hypothetical protein
MKDSDGIERSNDVDTSTQLDKLLDSRSLFNFSSFNYKGQFHAVHVRGIQVPIFSVPRMLCRTFPALQI